MKKVVIAAQERIDDFEHTAIEFFRAVLGMDYCECIVTDESRLTTSPAAACQRTSLTQRGQHRGLLQQFRN